MKKYEKLIILLLGIVVLILLLMPDKNEETTSIKTAEGYTEIKDISGLSFSMNDKLLDLSTAIMQISNDSELDASNFYIYKNGYDQYIMFNMEKLVVLVQKGTSFGFDKAENMEEALKSASVCNIWFEKCGKELESKKNDDLYLLNANAQITINKRLYGDFTGILAVISDGVEEWSLYAGVPGNDLEDISEIDLNLLETITSSVKLSGAYASAQTINESLQNAATETSEEHKQDSSNTTVEVVEVVSQEVGQKQNTKEEDTQKAGEIVANNQKQKVKEIGDAYRSDIYSMLSIGDKGLLSAYNFDTNQYEMPVICIEELYTGPDAKEFIKKNLKEYEYFNAKDGCSYHAVVYSVDYTTCQGEPYINIKIKGLDGDVLKFRGIKYTKKTHDILTSIKGEGKDKENFICYYEVPNGCKEYILECGEGSITTNPDILAAYYKISL